MWKFVLGVVVGYVAATYLRRSETQHLLDRQIAEMQDRGNAMLNESRRVLEETRQEMAANLDTLRQSVEARAEQVRKAMERDSDREADGPDHEVAENPRD